MPSRVFMVALEPDGGLFRRLQTDPLSRDEPRRDPCDTLLTVDGGTEGRVCLFPEEYFLVHFVICGFKARRLFQVCPPTQA